MGMFDLPANPWQPQTNIATKLRELYVRLGLLGNNRQQDIQNAIQDPAGVAERLAGTVNEYIQDPMSYVGGGIGHIAYHGSPYKFDKFSLDKIGTGEGAQAYGHGLYLAESQAVSKGYMQSNPLGMDVGQEAAKRGINLSAGARGELVRQARANADPKVAARRLQNANSSTRDIDTNSLSEVISEYQKSLDGNLYQVDLPDDQIAKMLDWDKPLSEQTEQVKQALRDAAESGKLKGGYITGAMGERKYQPALSWGKSGESLLRSLERVVGFGGNAEALLKDIGIPGIRYLDGGSRSGGSGTSNFVAFDPEMIRILERNGIPTGNQPWKPGEFNIFKDTTESAPLFRDTTR